MFFDSWASVGRVIVAGTCAYAALVVMLRLSGKRTLSKMNAFDLVITVAIGSTLSSVITSKQVPIVDGLVALALLVALQYVVAFAASRSSAVDAAVRSEPRVVFHRGRFARTAMRDERLTEGEILAAVRAARVASLDEVDAVVLESSGDLSVLRRPDRSSAGPRTVLEGTRLDAAPERGPER
jgi:uncharacterized membrane protein YcaP (DUF421 family)